MSLKNVIIQLLGASILLSTADLTAVTYTVTAGTDSAVDTGGDPGELRYVLNSILNDQAVNGTPTDRQIIFAPGVSKVTLNGILPMINLFQGDPTQINPGGNVVTIDGNGYRPFYVAQGSDVSFENLHIIHAAAIGGTGGSGSGAYSTGLGGGGGGGGMGAGGAIFVDSASVKLSNVSFSSNKAVGGAGGSVLVGSEGEVGLGGGGGLGGNGGDGLPSAGFGAGGGGGGGYSGHGGAGYGEAGGGGGGFGNGGDSGSSANSAGGGGGGAIIGANGGSGNGGSGTGLLNFGGGGAGGSADPIATDGGSGGGVLAGAGGATSGGGGGGGYNGASGGVGPAGGVGGAGGLGGGGGGASGNTYDSGGIGGLGSGSGGAGRHSYSIPPQGGYGGGGGGFGVGGFGGGGGGGGFGFGGFGGGGGGGDFGVGGFGGGGGGGFGVGFGGVGGVGAGVGSTEGVSGSDGGGGGGGAGFGGAIFVNKGSVVFHGDCKFKNSSVEPGAGGTPASIAGATAGSDIFFLSGASLTFEPGPDHKISLSGSISDDSAHSVPGGDGVTPGTGVGGSIVKNGEGTLLLKGVSSYIGGTSLNSGTLVVNGQIVGPLTSAPGSHLRGTGSVGDVTLYGSIAPGDNDVGVLTASSIDFQTASVLSIELNPTEASLLQVTGAAEISGPTLIVVTEDSGSYTSNTKYKVLKASGPITGTGYLTVINTNPKFRLVIDTSVDNEVSLILSKKK